ncbi:MAG: hypothetical protein IT364_05565 [Candidatus Hydrogenedentes bacterium]|nr:hypothetical protein [Candidatus Hydrogenedentota bacterium]
MLLVWVCLTLSAAATEPLSLPDNFDPALAMLRDGDRHSSREAAELAERLLENGTPQDIETAVKVLDAVIACQEQREGARHQGNFLWNREDEAIRDLNGVEFVLRHLIPMMIRHGGRLPEDVRTRVLTCIRRGVDEVRRMDVAVTYTNIATMDCLNSCLGGELLNDPAVTQRGYAKLKELADVTTANGTVYEFYSPGYTQVTVDALHRLSSLARDRETAVRARTMLARLALTTALHIPPSTGRLTGPFSRAYFDEVMGESESESEYLRAWAAEGVVPDWIAMVLDRSMPLPVQIGETSARAWSMGATTYLAKDFSLGTASREVSNQTSGLVIRYPIPGSPQPGTVFSRYLVNDTWFEPSDTPEDRSSYLSLRDTGKHFAVQAGARALYVCSPRQTAYVDSFAPCTRDYWHSAKAALIWSRRDTVDAIWAGERLLETLPAEVQPGEVVVVDSGPVFVGIMPMSRTDLGYGAPLRVAEAQGMLAFEMYNYLGGPKVHNDLERMSRFYRGQPKNAFYVEVAERAAYPDAQAFGKAIAAGAVKDEAAPEFTVYNENADRPWVLEYQRDGQMIGLEVDLIDWTLTRRWTEKGDLGFPMLESPVARQNDTGRVEVAGAVLECPPAPAWVYADPERDFYVAGYHGDPGTLTLTLPKNRVTIENMGTGTVVYQAGKVTIDALGDPVLGD